jgi:2-haloacid dehalogenase
MTIRPKVIVFDIIETVFSLEPMRTRLVSAGLPGLTLEAWFAAGLRDAFALAATGYFSPFRSVLEGALNDVLTKHGLRTDAAQISLILDGMKELEPRPDALESFRHLSEAGFRIVALSNGAKSATEALLKNAGFDRFFEGVFSVEDVKLSKPREEVYRHVVQRLDLEPEWVALVAAHAWDTHGAKSVGLTTVFISRGLPYPAVMLPPDIVAPELLDATRVLVDLAR